MERDITDCWSCHRELTQRYPKQPVDHFADRGDNDIRSVFFHMVTAAPKCGANECYGDFATT